MNKFSLPVVAAVVRAAAQMVVRRRSRAPGRRARRVQRTIGHVAARPRKDRVDAGGGDGVEGPRVDALMYIQVRQAAVILLDDRRVVDLAAARVSVKALPVAFNFKVAPWCDRDAHDGTRQIGAVHLVNGNVRVVHQKGLEDEGVSRKERRRVLHVRFGSIDNHAQLARRARIRSGPGRHGPDAFKAGVVAAPRAFVRPAVARPVPVPQGVDLRERRAALAPPSDL